MNEKTSSILHKLDDTLYQPDNLKENLKIFLKGLQDITNEMIDEMKSLERHILGVRAAVKTANKENYVKAYKSLLNQGKDEEITWKMVTMEALEQSLKEHIMKTRRDTSSNETIH